MPSPKRRSDANGESPSTIDGRRQDRRRDGLLGARTDVVHQKEHPFQAHDIPRIDDEPDVRDDVLDVGGLHELEAAVFDKRDVSLFQLDLEIERVEARTEQHANLVERHALFA